MPDSSWQQDGGIPVEHGSSRQNHARPGANPDPATCTRHFFPVPVLIQEFAFRGGHPPYSSKAVHPVHAMKLFFRKAAMAILPRSFLLKTRYRCGVVVAGQNKPGHGGRGLFLFGESLEPELNCLEKLLRPGDTFVDVGANVGAYTIKAGRLVGERGAVVAIEPFPGMASALLNNVLANRLNNVRLRVGCAADQDGHQQFWMNDGKPNSFSLVPKPGSVSFDSAVFSLDTLLAREAIKRVDVLKIDAEGAENLVLRGAQESILRDHPLIIAEDTIETNIRLFPGYQCWKILGSPNVLFIHKESHLHSLPAQEGWQSKHL